MPELTFARIDKRLAELRQGDVFESSVFLSLIEKDTPLTSAGSVIADSQANSGWAVRENPTPMAVIITQTCDVVRPSEGRPWVRVAPVKVLDDETAPNAAAKRMPRYAQVKWVGENLFADLDRATTIEKSVLVGLKRVGTCADTRQVMEFADACARSVGRFPFPESFEEWLPPLNKHFRKRAGRPHNEGTCLDAVLQVRTEVEPPWYDTDETTRRSVLLHFIVDAKHLQALDHDELVDLTVESQAGVMSKEELCAALSTPSSGSRQLRHAMWQKLVESWVGLMSSAHPIYGTARAMASSEGEFTLLQARTTQQLDLDHLSKDSD